MALLDDVNSELATIDDDLPAAMVAQAAAMFQFGGGLRQTSNKQIVLFAQFDSLEAAKWLHNAIVNQFQHQAQEVAKRQPVHEQNAAKQPKFDAKIKSVRHQTPQGQILQRYNVVVERGAMGLAVWLGLYNPRTRRVVRGLPSEIVNGKIPQIKAAWRGAFMAHGLISDIGTASYLEVVCPTHEASLALQGAAHRLGISAKTRKVRSSERVTLRDPDAIERLLILLGAPRSAREWTGKRTDGEPRGKTNRLANFDDANMRRSAKAAEEATKKVREAFEILGDDIPPKLRAAGQLRLDHSEASLEELGRLADPPISKDAIAGRIRRLLQKAEKAQKIQRQAE
ncbi:DNA-binding protein WhiA [Bifidobacterium boum]|uniref:Probable cell division protein WhiA n=1 Tax=Bifidobacterium boum TaxID=78343 RepID=A0A086ZRL7_9BIFI|nr:DNA-binding protein WhiA [Bifidobacterium boum]MDO5685330.1 DNA-binding protein WhiA [Bifidobacterium sp.]KFI49167.1 putative transcriptional regulatory protein WhiA [Bifidobacterium boum]MCF2561166.1 DNA-binding protein WhiA [Bifidobacterium boum]MCI5861004.1 DNA-binding protein WhiA [Bifidobacterium boum]MDD6086525.1 DNA-binding protein WhiA [Bifidobacterium boum]